MSSTMDEPRSEPGEPEPTGGALEVTRQKTKQYALSLWEMIGRYARQRREEPDSAPSDAPPERFAYRRGYRLSLLRGIPYLLAALFLLSFFWDFPGLAYAPWGYPLELQGLLRILSISGLIGYLTNWLAITMLFRPASPRPLLGHGLIPAQKERIAWRLAQTVSEDLINPEIIKQKIHESQAISRYREEATGYIRGIIDDPRFREELKGWVVAYVDEMIADPEVRSAIAAKILGQVEDALENKTIEKVALQAYSFVRGQQMQEIIEESLRRLPASVESGLDRLDELLDRLPATLDRHSDTIEDLVTALLYRLVNRLDVKTLVEEKLNEYDEQKLTRIIRGATNEQLRYIQYLGAILGTVGGFVIWEPLLSLLVLGTAGVLLVGLDALLLRVRG